MLKCREFGGKSDPFPVGQVVRMVRCVAMVRIRVEREPEPTRKIGPVVNTSQVVQYLRTIFLHTVFSTVPSIRNSSRPDGMVNCRPSEGRMKTVSYF
jgi:hypothetical protein